VVVLQADEGEEVVKGESLSFVNPRAFQDGPAPRVGDTIEFDVVKKGKHTTAKNIRQATPCICIGCCALQQSNEKEN
jgi:hypothetical protein